MPRSRESPRSSDDRSPAWRRTLESTRTPVNAVAVSFRTEIAMSEARNADVQMSVETVISETPQRGDVLERGLLIGGKSVPASSGKLADDVCPWDGEIYARVAAGTPADITRAADAAQAAFSSWSTMGAFERREIFLRAADVMAKRGEEAIVALARETGASRVFSEFNVAFCIQVLREAAAAITRPAGELLPTSIPGAYSMAQRIPLGVVAAISPWNAPLVLGIRSIAIPLAVGNTVVMKPSEDAPITCGLLLADVLTEAGLPAGSLMSSPTTWLMPATWSRPSSPPREC